MPFIITRLPINYYNYTGILYDRHKNPFANISESVFLGLASAGYLPTGYFGGTFVVSSNNITSLVTNESYNQEIPFTISYNASSFIYNRNDYPVSCSYSTAVPYGVVPTPS